MIERMPTRQLVAMLKGAGPAESARVLRSVPDDHIGPIIADMEASLVVGIIVAAQPDQASYLIGSITPDRVSSIIQHMSMRQLLDLTAVLPPETAACCLEQVPPPVAADVIWELPKAVGSSILELVSETHAMAITRGLYQRRAEESIVRIAPRVWWLDQTTCDLLALVLNRSIRFAVRYRSDGELTGTDVDDVLSRRFDQPVSGVVVLTNAQVAASARGRAGDGQAHLMRWSDSRDDGDLKRLLVRVVPG